MLKNISFLLLIFFLFSCEKNEKSITDNSKITQNDTLNAQEGHISANKHVYVQNFDKLVTEFESTEREDWKQRERIFQKISPIEGATILDIGAGTGFFTFALAEKAKKVIALDIDKRFIDFIKNKRKTLPENQQKKIETRLISPEDPRLANNEADVAMLVNVYHHISSRLVYLKKIRKGLQKQGKILIIEFKKGDMGINFGPPENMKLDAKTITNELEKAGFENIKIDTETLKYQVVITAKKKNK